MEQAPSLRSGGPWRSGWRRLRRDRGGMLALVAVVVLLLLALFGSAVVSRLVGHDGNTPFIYAAGDDRRAGRAWTHVADPANPPFGEYGNLLPAPKGSKHVSSCSARTGRSAATS